MIYILRTLEIIKVGEVYPFPFDTSKSAMLSRITYIRNETIQNFDGKLSDDQFNQYWDDIGQAVLTLVTWHIQDIQDDEDKTQLFGNLLRLNPIKIDKKILCSFIHMSETYPALILEQLISEYCKFKDMEIAEILLEEKHKLFHKRIKTESCCKCTNSFVKEIPEISEKQWEALYEMIEDNNSHFCKSGPNKCSERFVPKTIKTCDLSVTMILFLHIPDILSHTINRSCINEFYTLLEKNKHTIYHSMEKEKCCACNKDPTEKLLIKKEEWNRLFQKENRKPCQTGTKDCCCEYSARRGLEILNLEGTFLSKIFHVAGPISILNKVWQDAFLQFLNWTIDDQPLREALTELLNKSTDKTFYNDMLKRISQCNFSELDETLAKQVELRGWCSKHLRNKKASTEPQLKILVFGKDGWKVESVHVPKDFPLPKRTRELQNVTVMENNFIVVMYGLTNIVYSVVENEFNTHCPDSVLKEICSGIYKDFFKDSCNGKDKGQKERILLSQKQREQIFSLELKDSKKFDLELMIFLLKRRPTYEGKNDYDFQLETIDNINRQIIQSSSGALDEAKFKEIMEDLTKALVHLGGKVYEKKLLHLQHVRNILGLFILVHAIFKSVMI
ncbi:unnamed protein product [Mytilus coruscus]|uniref:DZIP3-like HEPN domain-containing protein n=1 Tax=Mytilus coruscus TaxID=42192 RepID=A0A6J8B541_MYTCO|nr:unnamed protein product [Mytilus coruscus]